MTPTSASLPADASTVGTAIKALHDQIRRDYKTKIAVLTFALASSWLIASAVSAAGPALQAVNRRSIEARSRILPAAPRHNSAIDAHSAPLMDREELSVLQRVLANSTNPEIPRVKELKALENERRNAYKVEVSLSSLPKPIEVDVLPVIDVAPFIGVCLLGFIALLGIRQQGCRRLMAGLVYAELSSGAERSMQSAMVGFSIGRLSKILIYNREVAIFRQPPLLLNPERLITVALLLSITWISRGIPFPKDLDEAGSVIGYHTALLIFALVLLRLLWGAKQRLDDHVESVVGSRVRSRFSAAALIIWRKLIAVVGAEVLNKRLIIIVSACAALSLLLPWVLVVMRPLYGYELLLPQRLQSSGPIKVVSIVPDEFFEMRFQLTIALIFIVSMGVARIKGNASSRLNSSGRLFAAAASVIALTGILNYCVFLVVLYNKSMAGQSATFLQTIFGSLGSAGPRGFITVDALAPAVGFYIFISSLSLLCVLQIVNWQYAYQREQNAEGICDGR